MIELKTGSASAKITKRNLDQLGGRIRWDEREHPGVTAVPVMVHPSRGCERGGTSVPGMRVVTPDKLEELKEAVRACAVALA